MSGSAFLALVRDSAPANKRGIAIGIVETILIACFPVAAIGFGRWMEQYEAAVFWQLILFTSVVGLFFWIFATFGAEKKMAHNSTPSAPKMPLRDTFAIIWGDGRTRAFFVFLATATFFAWMQDNVLEPFGGDVFDYGAGVTTRFTGYWGGATILVVVICFGLFRRQRPENQNGISSWGLAVMGVGMLLIAAVSVWNRPNLLSLALVVFGLGFGFYTFGGLSLMAAMSPTKNAGAYLGLWTACILLSKGSGTFFGGLLRDVFVRWIGLAPSLGYGLIFVVAGLGLFVAALQVRKIDVAGFVAENG